MRRGYAKYVVKLWLVFGWGVSVHVSRTRCDLAKRTFQIIFVLFFYDFVGVVVDFVVGWTRAINANTYKKKYRENRNINVGSLQEKQ